MHPKISNVLALLIVINISTCVASGGKKVWTKASALCCGRQKDTEEEHESVGYPLLQTTRVDAKAAKA